MPYLKYFKSSVDNLLSNLRGYRLTYVVENSDWVINKIGGAVTFELNDARVLRSRVSYAPFLLRNQMVHFGSENTLFGFYKYNFSWDMTRMVLTWFHAAPDDPRLKLIKDIQKNISVIHVSCQAMKKMLTAAGAAPEKIIVISLGVDLRIFRPVHAQEKTGIKKELGIPAGRPVIGSFQKDGVGWGEGNEPKLIKGPDVFVKTIIKLKKYRPFVLLSGPARGYVKKKLSENRIDYKHVIAKNYADMPRLYHALDLYVIPARLEGGPMGLLEAWACGVPVVSTRVGMAQDLIENGKNGFISAVADDAQLSENAKQIIGSSMRGQSMIDYNLKYILQFDSRRIAKVYYEKIYRKLLLS